MKKKLIMRITDRTEIKKILVISIKYLGDLVVQTPAFKSLRAAYPDARIILMLRKEFQSLFYNSPLFDYLIPVDFTIKNLKGLARLKEEKKIVSLLRSYKFDAVINMQAGDRYTLWAWLSGAKYRIAPQKQSLHYLNNINVNVEEDTISYLDYYLKIIEAFDIPAITRETEIYINDTYHEWAIKFFNDNNLQNKIVIGIHPGASMRSKMWHWKNYSALIDQLSIHQKVKIILFCGPKEKEIVSHILNSFTNPLIVADTSDDINKLSALMTKCSLCLTNDSAARHLSVAVKTTTLSLIPADYVKCWDFYSEKNKHYSLIGKRVLSEKENKSYLDGITVESVHQKIKELLQL